MGYFNVCFVWFKMGFLGKLYSKKGGGIMIKGAQRRMIVVKTGESNIFYEAHFLVRCGCECDEIDMLEEANKIAEGFLVKEKKKKRRFNTNAAFGIGGITIGAIGGVLISVLVNLGI